MQQGDVRKVRLDCGARQGARHDVGGCGRAGLVTEEEGRGRFVLLLRLDHRRRGAVVLGVDVPGHEGLLVVVEELVEARVDDQFFHISSKAANHEFVKRMTAQGEVCEPVLVASRVA